MYIIYGKPGCVNCEKSKMFLEMKNIPFEYKDVHSDEEALAFVVKEGFKAVPIIFDGEEYVGGYNDLKSYVLFREGGKLNG